MQAVYVQEVFVSGMLLNYIYIYTHYIYRTHVYYIYTIVYPTSKTETDALVNVLVHKKLNEFPQY